MMIKHPLPFTEILHENLSILMSFAYSQRPLNEMVKRKFTGEWEYLRKALFEIAAQRAERASLELALVLRILDDDWHISARTSSSHNCGKLVMRDNTEKDLPF